MLTKHWNALLLLGLIALLGTTVFKPDHACAEEKVLASGVAAIDIPQTKAKLVQLELNDAKFSEFGVNKLTLSLHDVDFQQGSLSSLGMDIANGDFDPIIVDRMTVNTQAFQFDPFILMNQRRFELAQPITGSVALTISEASLNHFLKNPKTVSKIENAIQKKTGGIKLISFQNPSLKLLKGNEVQVDMTATVAEGIAVPVQIVGELALKNQNLAFTNLRMNSQENAVPLPTDISRVMEKQLNDMINLEKLGKKSFVIRANSLKMKKGLVEVAGNATFTRLEIGAK